MSIIVEKLALCTGQSRAFGCLSIGWDQSPPLGNYFWLIKVTALESYATVSPNKAGIQVNWRAWGTLYKWVSSLPSYHEPWIYSWSSIPHEDQVQRVHLRSESSLTCSLSQQYSPVSISWNLTSIDHALWIYVSERAPWNLTLNSSVNYKLTFV